MLKKTLLQLTCVLVILPCLSSIAGGEEWKSLFNGKDLSGWKSIQGPMASWTVNDGVLSCSGAGGGWLATDENYANFELELEFQISKDGNSGVFLRSPQEGDPAYVGLEVQILDDTSQKYANLKPWQFSGSIYDLIAPSDRASKKPEEWQKLKILCDHRTLQITLNGTKIVDTNLDDYKQREDKHPGLKRTTGLIGLQNHGQAVAFKNMRIRPLP